MIITNKKQLSVVSEDATLFDSENIINKLNRELSMTETGVGLSAIQIGLKKNICIIRVKDPINLMNPIIIESFDLMEFHHEGCLSFPGERIKTKRYNEIFVKDVFHPNGFIVTSFEAVVIQHEIDHLNGIIMHDREIQIPNNKNQKCWCFSGKKYKNCHFGMKINY